MLIQNKLIAIVGAGPGGLTLARLLQLKGATVKVYERDVNKNTRVQGSPLDMHEWSGALALEEAGLMNEFRKNIRHGADKKIIVDKDGQVVFSDHNIDTSSVARPEIDRGELRKIILESLLPETVVWDSHFISMERQGDGWLMRFKNGISAYADLVVAADGANSKIRPCITGSKPLYSGITMLEINIADAKNTTPEICTLLNGGKVMAFSNSQCILGGQKGHGDLGFYLSFKIDKNWVSNNGIDYNNKAQMLSWFRQEYKGWGDIWEQLIAHTATPVTPRLIYFMPLDQTWDATSNLTLLGDAAHVMPPFAGEGANTAMRDALELSECLTNCRYNNLQEAISAYEASMRKRAVKATKQSLENGQRMHNDGALQRMVDIFSGKYV